MLNREYVTKGSAVCLCRIRWYPKGLITMRPPMNKIHRFTHISGTYTYNLGNASHKLSIHDMAKEWEIYEEFFKRTALIRNKMIGNSFSRVPDSYWSRLGIYGEVMFASNFDSSNPIYVKYSLGVSRDWYIDENSPNYLKSSSTQCAVPKYNKETKRYEARFSCPFEFFLYAKTSGMNQS
jgi:hypothetical protein